MNQNDLKVIVDLAIKLFGVTPEDIREEMGEQGASGALVHYFSCNIKGDKTKFVAKNATNFEIQVLELLKSQDQAIPYFECSKVKDVRGWLVMEYLHEIPFADFETDVWANKLGSALAKVHYSNRGMRPNWLPPLDKLSPLESVFASQWEEEYNQLLVNNVKFAKEYGSIQSKLFSSWLEFKKAVDTELTDENNFTLISTDLTPSHWRHRDGLPVFIDWEQARFGPLYFDLPNLLNDKTVKFYYQELINLGWLIPKQEFAMKFSLLSRYLGFRYMTVGFDYWRGELNNNLPGDYWETSGKSFFNQCLEIAQNGYNLPKL